MFAMRAVLCLFAATSLAAQDAPLPPPPPVEKPISEYVRHVFEDRAGHLWLGTNDDGVARWDGTALTWFDGRVGFPGRAIRGIVQTPDGAMWFATDAGVSRWCDGMFTNYTVAHGLPSAECWSLYCDRHGTIWVGTANGPCRLVGARFERFDVPRTKVPGATMRFAPEVVWDMAELRDGTLLLASDGAGVHRWDGTKLTTWTTADGLGGDSVRSVCVDRAGKVWFGSDGGGLTCFDGTAWRTWTSKDGLGNDRIFGIVEARDGTLWISTLGEGLARWDGTMFSLLRETAGRTRNHVQSILQRRDGTMWFGFSGGLYRLVGTSLVHVTRDGPWR